MNRHIFLILTLAVALGAVAKPEQQSRKLVSYVNPFVGTDGYGNVYPGAQIPFGGIQISPDTPTAPYRISKICFTHFSPWNP